MREKEPNIFEQSEEKTKLEDKLRAYYNSFPERRKIGNPDSTLIEEMSSFLVKKDYIRKIKEWDSWGCKYEEGTIYLNKYPMPQEQEEYYIFRLGESSLTGDSLFPKTKEGVGGEVDQYRFIHEASHAYQEWLKDQGDPEKWFDNTISKRPEEKSSPFERMFKFCYDKRQENRKKGFLFGLSTFGNVPNYDKWGEQKAHEYLERKEKNEENIEKAIDYGLRCVDATRSLEDSNELVTMYLWHPEYLNTFLEYLSGNIDGYGDQDLKKDKLVEITNEEKEFLKKNILQYIEEMKENIR